MTRNPICDPLLSGSTVHVQHHLMSCVVCGSYRDVRQACGMSNVLRLGLFDKWWLFAPPDNIVASLQPNELYVTQNGAINAGYSGFQPQDSSISYLVRWLDLPTAAEHEPAAHPVVSHKRRASIAAGSRAWIGGSCLSEGRYRRSTACSCPPGLSQHTNFERRCILLKGHLRAAIL